MNDPLSGLPILQNTLNNNGNDLFNQSIDLRYLTEGIFKIKGNGTNLTTLYISNEFAQSENLGALEINYTPVNSTTLAEKQIILDFKAKETYWKYLVVNKTGNIDFSTLAINGPLNFNSTSAAQDEKVNGLETLIFRTALPVLFKDKVKTGLKLTDNSNFQINHLPNPTIRGICKRNKDNPSELESEILIFI